mmetsp:Transcript_13094/g.26633  ORF Transcript_13094/g.26633 Transcript_13094/m.26633 type:complete len:251 (+) Transcript_13094:524-1276(+)
MATMATFPPKRHFESPSSWACSASLSFSTPIGSREAATTVRSSRRILPRPSSRRMFAGTGTGMVAIASNGARRGPSKREGMESKSPSTTAVEARRPNWRRERPRRPNWRKSGNVFERRRRSCARKKTKTGRTRSNWRLRRRSGMRRTMPRGRSFRKTMRKTQEKMLATMARTTMTTTMTFTYPIHATTYHPSTTARPLTITSPSPPRAPAAPTSSKPSNSKTKGSPTSNSSERNTPPNRSIPTSFIGPRP